MTDAAFDYDRFGTAGVRLRANRLRIARAYASGFRPPERLTVSEWAGRHRQFGEDAPYPGRWRHEVAPYLVEIMDRLSPHDPASEVPILKCSQSGGSAAGENWIGFIADVAPGPSMYVQGTIGAAADWARNKLWPMIHASPRLDPARGGLVRAQADGGSTKFQIDFAKGGYLLLAGANSAPTLAQKTIRNVIEDDIDQFPDDLDGQGSPESMVTSRLKVFARLGLSKRMKIGTPTVKGASKIDAAYSDSDRRRLYLKCPHCAARFDPIWEVGDDAERDIHWPEGKPEAAYLVTPCCKGRVEHWQKLAMILVDGWCPTVEIDGVKPPRWMDEETFQTWRNRDIGGLNPGYHITGIITVFDTWASLAAKFVKALGDPNKMKAWVMLDLGHAFEAKGEAPDHEKLAALVEQDWGGRARRLPVGVIATTAGVDVQGDGLYYELDGWGPDGENWTIEAGFVPGETDVPGVGAWADLHEILQRGVVFPGGRPLPIDQECIDGGYNTAAAEAFCRLSPRRLLVFGRGGWTLPVLGRGENLKYETQGRHAGRASKRAEDKAYLVGTFGVKLSLYGFLKRTLKAHEAELAGDRLEMFGRCRFGQDLPSDFFEQLTSETIVTKVTNGIPRRVWDKMAGRENHYLDCKVYNHAAAAKLKIDTLSDMDWERLKADRYTEFVPPQGDLFDQGLAAGAAPAPAKPNPVRNAPSSFVDAGEDYL